MKNLKKIKIKDKVRIFQRRGLSELSGAKIKEIKTFKDDCEYVQIIMDNKMIIQIGGDEMEAIIFKKTND